MTLAAALFLFAAQTTSDAAADSRIEVRAMSLEKALPLIGAKLGVQMRAAPTLAKELVFASFTSRDAEAFRTQMAKTFAAEWRQDENGIWHMNRSSQLRAAEERANRQKQLEGMRKSMEKGRKAAALDAPFDAAAAETLVKDLKSFMALPRPNDNTYNAAYYSKARALDQRGPSQRIIRRILEKLPIELLIGDGSPDRTVYSTRPTKMQLPMPVDVMPEVKRYVLEQNMWAEAMSSAGLPENQEGMYTSLTYQKQRIDKSPGVITLVIQERWGSRQIALKAYDADGRQILDQSEGIGNMTAEDGEDLQKQMKENPRKFKIEFSPEAKRFSEVFDDNAVRRKAKGITTADYAAYFDVETRDPMSFGASEILQAVAKAENRNLIVRLDDNFFFLTYVNQIPDFAKEGEMDATILNYLTQSVEENGWTRMTPRDPEMTRRAFYDRKDLARALALVAQGGRLTVERQAELALITPDNPEMKPMFRLLSMVSESRMWGNDDFLRLYGTLTPAQRQAANSEQGLSFARLSEASMAVLNRLAYMSDEWRLQYNPSESLQETFKNGNDPNQELFYGGYLREPTFSLPNGLSRTGTIKIVSETKDKVKTGSTTRSWGAQEGEVMTAEEMANNSFQTSNPKRFPWAQDEWNQKNYDAMTLVNQQSVQIEIRFDDRITTNMTLTSDVPLEGGPYTLKTLPKTFRDAYLTELRRLEEQYKDQPIPDYGDYQPGGRRNTTPPPLR